MAITWDTLITVFILVTFALAIWARISRQTIPELIGNIIDMVRGKSEDTTDDIVGYYG